MNRNLFYPLLLCRLLNFSSNYFHVSRNLFIYKHAWDRIPETKNFERPSQEDINWGLIKSVRCAYIFI